MPVLPPRFRPFARQATGALTVAALCGFLPASALAQNAARPGSWTIEVYGGGSSSSGSSTGSPLASFDAGTPFTTESSRPSRAVSSWYFGDGAALLNQVLTQFSTINGTTFPRLVPLDAALRESGGRRGSGGAFGLRIGRVLTPRLAFEINVERSMASLELSSGLKDALQKSSDSFKDSFQALLDTAPATALVVTSTITMPKASNTQTRVGGALKFTVYSGSRLEAYLTGGGGVLLNGGESPRAILNGKYTFRLFGTFPMDETDRVTVTVNQPKNSAMGLVGGGLTYDLSSHTGLRADVRMLINSTSDVTTLTAAPAVVTATPVGVLPSVTSPAIQFSNQANIRSTLSGPNQNLTVFTGSGSNRQTSVTLGIFRRF